MLDGWSVCIGAKSSGDCQVASAPAKYILAGTENA